MSALVCDMRKACSLRISDEMIEAFKHLQPKDQQTKDFISILTETKLSFNGDHYFNIPFEEIQEGDILICDVNNVMEWGHNWQKIRIDHIYRKMVFIQFSRQVKKRFLKKEA